MVRKRKRGCCHPRNRRRRDNANSVVPKVNSKGHLIYNQSCMKVQRFSLPKPVMLYVVRCQIGRIQQKLRQTCKYFYKLNPMYIVGDLLFGRSGAERNPKKDALSFEKVDDMEVIDAVTNKIHLHRFDPNIMSKIKCCEAKEVHLGVCEISLEHFHYLTRSALVKRWLSPFAYIMDDEDLLVSIAHLLTFLPHAEDISAQIQGVVSPAAPTVSDRATKIKVMSLYSFGQLEVDEFYQFIEKSFAPNGRLQLIFGCKISNEWLTDFGAQISKKLEKWMPIEEKPFFTIFKPI